MSEVAIFDQSGLPFWRSAEEQRIGPNLVKLIA